MPLKKIGKGLLAFMACLLAYLVIAASWAQVSFNDAISKVPVASVNLSQRQIDILLRVEDPNFYEHPGLSLAEGQGFATISSAVASQVFLSDRKLDGVEGAFQALYRGVFRCCKRVDLGRDVMALVLNARLPKDRQLAQYVSEVYMGSHQGTAVIGLASAAESYLSKPLEQASESEFIGLVAMIKAPNLYHPLKNPSLHHLRAARIQALISGKCKPAGWFDTSYTQCDP
ncbi:transglycosylase domain-containing protein [Duganella sp. HH101]|uniref:transglycosylase domain-containing protein n=1 Tax=Duganella sp. HH101 TaxID=1781066 RepID=UPI0008746CDB|nr:transglycosylase domain-containing protein [Duganella sp. HH101]OFA02392.1 penicillin-binding protein 1B [Duganella sp. HH101]